MAARNQADIEFFRPLWRRLVLIAVVLAWFGYESIFVGEQLWMMISGGMAAYAIWTYLYRWEKEKAE
jgi:hypothetical protein